MTTLTGQLRGRSRNGFAGYHVAAAFTEKIVLGSAGANGTPPASEPLWLPASRVAVADESGRFAIRFPADGSWRGPVAIQGRAPSGEVVGLAEVAEGEIGRRLTLDVAPITIPVVERSDDPSLGRRLRLSGRVLDPQGQGAAAGLLVVLWGIPVGGADDDAYPLLVSETSDGGYFAEDWPVDTLERAYGVVAGGDPIPIPVADRLLPRQVVLVLPAIVPAPPKSADEDCDCRPVPPRNPDADELAANPAFSTDLGGRCIDLTVPNRALDEVTFHAVVRTSEPEIKGLTLEEPKPLPPGLVRLLSLTVTSEMMEAATAPRARMMSAPPPTTTAAFSHGPIRTENTPDLSEPVSTSGPPLREVLAAQDLAARSQAANARLTLHPEQLTELVRDPGSVTPFKLLNAEHLSRMKLVTDAVKVLDRGTPGRYELDGHRVIDWDDTPTTYQATTIAIGHLLTFKQVWHADGYSLGDLLYSMPLAPGQKKQVAVLDWDRRELSTRTAERRTTEDLAADLVHDRDISEIITSSLSERLRGRSSADTEAIGAGIGGFIGPVLFGFGGGASSAGSTASQNSSRNVAGTSLNQARDRTLQSASAVRTQRTSVVQTARQGESLRVQTEVVANYNHCHAITVEYFEVLRHFQVSQELVHVQECLFVPFELTVFSDEKSARWREPLARFLRRRDLRGGFDALDRVRTNWVDADYPTQRYADEVIEYLDGELWISFDLPRPRDTTDDKYDAAQWAPYAAYLSQPTADIWQTYLGVVLPADRNRVWNRQLAPRVAARLVDAIRITLKLDGGTSQTILSLDSTLVSSFGQSQQLLVSLRPDLVGPGVTRARVSSVVISMATALPTAAKVVVWSGSMHYRTAHLSFTLFGHYRIHNDIGLADSVEIPTPLYYPEKRNPRAEDRRLSDNLVDHLNEHVEYYHQAIWRTMDPNRRFLLLDGFLAPNAGGKSVASVVENRLIGIIGNCLVMPVVPGIRLDKSYADGEVPLPLIHRYATEPPPPMRISVPTHGVFAEALMGACNSCELKDDARFWRWEESPIADSPTDILPVTTGTRATPPPSLAADEFSAPLVKFQNVSRAPDPTGLAAAMSLIGTPNLFRDLTGLDLNQQNAAAAFQSALSTAQFFGGEGAKLAQQQFHNKSLDRTIKRIADAKKSGLITDEQARQLTESAFKGSIGERRPAEQTPTSSPAVQRVIDRVAESRSAELHVNRPSGSVSVRTGEPPDGERFDFAVDPPVVPKAQPSNLTCWAAAGAMLLSWHDRVDLSVQAAADRAGTGWRQKLDANQALSVAEIKAYTKALGLVAEGLMCYLPRGIARLLRAHGPLWVVGDDAIDQNQMSHVRIVTGIKGDGSHDGTRIQFIDPATGSNSEESYVDFTRRMEAADPVATGLGIYHF